jgi:hypothetical protein
MPSWRSLTRRGIVTVALLCFSRVVLGWATITLVSSKNSTTEDYSLGSSMELRLGVSSPPPSGLLLPLSGCLTLLHSVRTDAELDGLDEHTIPRLDHFCFDWEIPGRSANWKVRQTAKSWVPKSAQWLVDAFFGIVIDGRSMYTLDVNRLIEVSAFPTSSSFHTLATFPPLPLTR